MTGHVFVGDGVRAEYDKTEKTNILESNTKTKTGKMYIVST